MNIQDNSRYHQVHARSLSDPEGFWGEAAREIDGVNIMVVREAASVSRRAARELRREQDEFINRRNASFGKPDYDLRKAMKARLDYLLAIESH